MRNVHLKGVGGGGEGMGLGSCTAGMQMAPKKTWEKRNKEGKTIPVLQQLLPPLTRRRRRKKLLFFSFLSVRLRLLTAKGKHVLTVWFALMEFLFGAFCKKKKATIVIHETLNVWREKQNVIHKSQLE